MEKLPVEFQYTLIGIADGSIAEPDITSIRKLYSIDYISFKYKVGWMLTHKGIEYLKQLSKYSSDTPQVRKFRALNS